MRSMNNDSHVSEADQILLDAAIAEAEVAYLKRKQEFMELMGMTEEQYSRASEHYDLYVAHIAHRRPFSRSPLAKESFIAGFYSGSHDV